MQNEFMELVKAVGPSAAISIAFLWITIKKTDVLESKVDVLNKYIREEQAEQNKANVLALEHTSSSMDALRGALDKHLEVSACRAPKEPVR